MKKLIILNLMVLIVFFINAQNHKEIKLGEQIWMQENLNVDKFRNGDPIPQAEDHKEWLAANAKRKPVWSYINYDATTEEKYGVLYNWYAVNDPRGIAPKGYHVPSDDEWKELAIYLVSAKEGFKELEEGQWITYLGKIINADRDTLISEQKKHYQTNQISSVKDGIPYINSKLKNTEVPIQISRIVKMGSDVENTKTWHPKGKIIDLNGFAALMGGRHVNGEYTNWFDGLEKKGYWWSNTSSSEEKAWSINVDFYFSDIHRQIANKADGFAIRCVKD
jgi:uncharacterized protein (TIGR02145 family)